MARCISSTRWYPVDDCRRAMLYFLAERQEIKGRQSSLTLRGPACTARTNHNTATAFCGDTRVFQCAMVLASVNINSKITHQRVYQQSFFYYLSGYIMPNMHVKYKRCCFAELKFFGVVLFDFHDVSILY